MKYEQACLALAIQEDYLVGAGDLTNRYPPPPCPFSTDLFPLPPLSPLPIPLPFPPARSSHPLSSHPSLSLLYSLSPHFLTLTQTHDHLITSTFDLSTT